MTCLFRSLEKTNSKQQCFHEIFFSMFSRVHFVLDKVARNASHSILKSRIVSKNASLKQSKDFLGQRKLLYFECQFIAKFLSKTSFSGKLPFDCIFVAKSGNLNFLQTPLFFFTEIRKHFWPPFFCLYSRPTQLQVNCNNKNILA